MKQFLKKKLVDPLKEYLKSGTSPHKLAQGIAWGLVLGLIPFIGINTALCAGVAIIFRINMGVIQLVNYFVYPLQLALFLPFIKLGIYLFGIGDIPYPLETVWQRLQTNFIETIGDIWMANMSGIVLWLIVAPLLYYSGYYLGKVAIGKLVIKEEE